MSHSVPRSQHAEHFAPWNTQSAVCIGRVKCQRTTSRVRTWSLLLFQNVIERGLFTVVVPGGTCVLRTSCGSAFGGGGRRAVILRARKRGIIDASCRSVHEWSATFFSKNQQNVQERRAHLHASQEWTNIPSEVVRLFAHGAGTGVSSTQKVSLCDATMCLVASDFFVYSLARRPTGGHQPLLINIVRIGCDCAEKFQRSASTRRCCWPAHLA